MFVRCKSNRSGSTSVQVIDKRQGYRVVKTIGVGGNPDEIEKLKQKGQQFIKAHSASQVSLFPLKSQTDLSVESFVEGLSNASIRTIGPELIFGTLFDRIGFGEIDDQLFRHLVIARLAYPTSKLKTVDYLQRYQGIKVSVQSLYRFLDRLQSQHKELVEQIAYTYTKRRLKQMTVVFYDMTTLYFEAEAEDDLRKVGFSKDGKFQNPQIMIGLLVGERGLPIGYDIFAGNTFEGHTLLPILKSVQTKFELGKPVVVADAALLSKDNLRDLKQAGFKYILGARIKNESKTIKAKILEKSKQMKEGDSFIIKKPDGNRLLVTYSVKRAKKDAYNRERGLKKLRLRVKSGKLTKTAINNRGYNKFLILDGKVEVGIDEGKVRQDESWDGLKGYITNSRLSADTITQNYSQLWQIEEAFRISKTDLRIRPIHHYRKNRIEAHILISFVAYTIYKELDRLLEEKHVQMSPRRAGELTHTMYQMEYLLPNSREYRNVILQMDPEQKTLYQAVHGCRR